MIQWMVLFFNLNVLIFNLVSPVFWMFSSSHENRNVLKSVQKLQLQLQISFNLKM